MNKTKISPFSKHQFQARYRENISDLQTIFHWNIFVGFFDDTSELVYVVAPGLLSPQEVLSTVDKSILRRTAYILQHTFWNLF